jgi:hypothetical protein
MWIDEVLPRLDHAGALEQIAFGRREQPGCQSYGGGGQAERCDSRFVPGSAFGGVHVFSLMYGVPVEFIV